MASLEWLIYHRLVAIEYAASNNPELRPVVLEKTKRHLLLRQHLVDIDQLWREKGIPYVVLKGIPLNQQLYGSLLRKYSGDIDILVNQHDLLTAHACLLSLGYQPQILLPLEKMLSYKNALYRFKDVVYHHTHDQTVVELHQQISDMNAMNFGDLSRAESVFVDGHSMPVLCREENFLYLCFHASLHHWQRLIWLTDVAEFYQKMHPSWVCVLEKAKQHVCIRPLLEARVLLAEKFSILLPAVPHGWRDKLATTLRLRYARHCWDPSPRSYSALREVLYFMLLIPAFAQKCQYFFGMLVKGEDSMRILQKASEPPFLIVLLIKITWIKAKKAWGRCLEPWSGKR